MRGGDSGESIGKYHNDLLSFTFYFIPLEEYGIDHLILTHKPNSPILISLKKLIFTTNKALLDYRSLIPYI